MGGAVINRFAFPPDMLMSYTKEYRKFIRPLLSKTCVCCKIHKIDAFIADFKPPRYSQTIIYCHGNGDTLTYLCPMLQVYSVLLKVRFVGFDWQGYGECIGKPSESAIKLASDAVMRFVLQEDEITRINVYSHSIGSVAAVYIAQKYKLIRSCVLQAPVASAYDCVFENPCSQIGNIFMNKSKISQTICPLYILHGTHDNVVPFRNSVILFERRAKGEYDEEFIPDCRMKRYYNKTNQSCFYTIYGADHNNIDSDYPMELSTVLCLALDIENQKEIGKRLKVINRQLMDRQMIDQDATTNTDDAKESNQLEPIVQLIHESLIDENPQKPNTEASTNITNVVWSE